MCSVITKNRIVLMCSMSYQMSPAFTILSYPLELTQACKLHSWVKWAPLDVGDHLNSI